jgi:uncharacterized membrane protein YeaQ/YmgE (transglycosylase-associated protein family)
LRPENAGFKEYAMGVIAFIVLGLIAGFIASLLVNHRGEGVFGDIILGIVGAVVGGLIAHVLGFHGLQRFNLYSLVIAVVGAVIVLAIYHALTGRGRGRPSGT